MQITYSDFISKLEEFYQRYIGDDLKIEFIKNVRNEFNLPLKDSKILVERYIDYRYFKCYPNTYNFGIADNVRNLTNGQIHFIDDTMSCTIKDDKIYHIVITGFDSYETNDLNEANRVKEYLIKLGYAPKLMQEV